MLLATCQIIQIKRQLLNGDKGTRMLCEALPRWYLDWRVSQSNQVDPLGYVLRIVMHLMQIKL